MTAAWLDLDSFWSWLSQSYPGHDGKPRQTAVTLTNEREIMNSNHDRGNILVTRPDIDIDITGVEKYSLQADIAMFG